MGDLEADFGKIQAIAERVKGRAGEYQAGHDGAKRARDGEGEWWGHGEEGEQFANGADGYKTGLVSGDESGPQIAEAGKTFGADLADSARLLEEQERANQQGLTAQA
ncbi:major facilitator superfamily permease [Segniliparus rotundus DSM 44985]|uniref:Major facilitator superfamily permease n=1 Tax=Segniliparus rotundus (strain ATCC BAA-972 / CDC 1076 / CIP 108378 / DSM 44985 / JCM 13578) TaxID=640132 RepID=D6ZAV1_SEGRD|nr:hypothetical protein [Segniliparus rotundus]ADG98837.1 major facilitator superfamily permease [Segniliparus rotundus DSM 44985]